MKKMFLLLISSFLMITIFLTGCSSESSVQTPQFTAINKIEKEIVNIPNYDDFAKFMEDFENNIDIAGFSLIQPYKTIFLIERDFTFNKKDTITVGGGSGDFNPTQQLFIFENKDKSIQFYVRFAYTEVDMGNNLVAWEVPTGYDQADSELLNRTDMATYTYRNLIVTVTQNAKTKANLSVTKNAVKSVLSTLDSYYSK
ncbi:hypothetical protein NSQ91_05775 [Paenibacillus sp. FSL R7-0048]|uniref:hypothetical protein n=1 Tax=Paenibacillus sp. FSL R7-0048 TaxID=2954528 RepID=UPI0030F77D6E